MDRRTGLLGKIPPVIRSWGILIAACLAVTLFVHFGRRQALENRIDGELGEINDQALSVVRSAANVSVRGYLRGRVTAARQLIEAFHLESARSELREDFAQDGAGLWLKYQQFGKAGFIFVINDQGVIQVHPQKDELMSLDLSNRKFVEEILERKQGYLHCDIRMPGERVPTPMALYMTPYEPWNWIVCAAIPRDERASLVDPANLKVGLDGLRSMPHALSLALDSEGRVIASSAETEKEQSIVRNAQLLKKIAQAPKTPFKEKVPGPGEGPDQKIKVIPQQPTGSSWIVVSIFDAEEVYRPLDDLGSQALFLWFALLVICAAGALLLRRLRRGKREVKSEVTTEVLFDQRVVELEHELKETKASRDKLATDYDQLNRWMDDVQQVAKENTLLKQMGDLLQACRSQEETYEIIMKLARELFPTDAGALLIFGEPQDQLETVATWGEALSGQREFTPDDCWALRRGKAHEATGADSDLLCRHLAGPPQFGYLCLPLIAQGEVLGLLHMQCGPPDAAGDDEANRAELTAKKKLASTITEQFSLALANLKLREELRVQSIRDQLTGLFNRRHMEESLIRELHRAERKKAPLSLIMLDIDHFKQLNDNFGHEEGDKLLRELGDLMRKNTRKADIACRCGGEEFLIIMPEASREITMQRAELLRKTVEETLKAPAREGDSSSVTISLGVALFPENGDTVETLMKAADDALYQAKDQGRNRVAAAPPPSA